MNGTLTPVLALNGSLSGGGNLGGNLGAMHLDAYDGAYNFQPTLEQQTAETAGKTLARNIVIAPITPNNGDVSDDIAVKSQKIVVPAGWTSGGTIGLDFLAVADCTAENIRQGASILGVNGSVLWDWKGDTPLKLSNTYSTSFKLSDTTFPSWTPSTTAKAIKSAVNAFTFSADMENYEYVIRWKCQFDAAYNDGATKKVQVYREDVVLWQTLCRRPNSLATVNSGSFVGNTCVTTQTVPLMIYYNSSGVQTYTYSASYGIYPSATAATFSNATGDNVTVTVKTPAYNARCSTTYFATARAAELDAANSIIKMSCDVWQVPLHSTQRVLYEDLFDLYLNPM